jgi:acyl-CoA synthetase (NDP forming)
MATAPARAGRRRTIHRPQAEAFLRLDRLAVIGVSADRTKFGNTVFRALRDHTVGTVVPVHRGGGEVEGEPAYGSVADVPGGVDGAIVMVSGPAADDAVTDCLRAGVSRIWLFQGLGAPGAMSEELAARCAAAGATVVAGACPLMFLEPVRGAHRFHRGVRTLLGRVDDDDGAVS